MLHRIRPWEKPRIIFDQVIPGQQLHKSYRNNSQYNTIISHTDPMVRSFIRIVSETILLIGRIIAV